jgi:hypothetical protein
MNVLQKAPNIVVACVTTIILATIAGVVLLTITGHSTTDFSYLIGNILSGLGVLGSGGAFLYASASARSAHNVEEQTNGTMDERISNGIQRALLAHDIEVHGVSPSVPPPLNTPGGIGGTE